MLNITRSLGAVLIAVYAATAPSPVAAQCDFEHPKKAGKFQTNLVQAFLGCLPYPSSCCGEADGTTEGNIPSCSFVESFHELSGSPTNGWTWDETKGSGLVSLKAAKTFPPSPLNPPNNSSDMLVKLKLSGVLAQPFGPGAGDGHLSFILRITWNDRANGAMTIVDAPFSFGFTMVGGKAKLKSSIDAALNGLPSMQPGMPSCSSSEVVAVDVTDPNGSTFASAGLFNP